MTRKPDSVLSMFPLQNVVFPSQTIALNVFEPRYVQLMHDLEIAAPAGLGPPMLGTVLIERGSEVGGGDQRASIGAILRVEQAQLIAPARYHLVLRGQRRIAVTSWLDDAPYPRAMVCSVPDLDNDGDNEPTDNNPSLCAATVDQIRKCNAVFNQIATKVGANAISPPAPPSALALWDLCARAPLGPFDRQRLLEVESVGARADLLHELLVEANEILDFTRQ